MNMSSPHIGCTSHFSVCLQSSMFVRNGDGRKTASESDFTVQSLLAHLPSSLILFQ